MGDMGWCRWWLEEGMAGDGDRLAAPCFRFVKQTHKRAWVSDASFEAVAGLCLEMGGYCRCSLSEEERKGRLGAGKAGTGISCLPTLWNR